MKTHTTRKILLLLFMVVPFLSSASPRERLLMNFDWQFTFGHPHDVEKDFNMGTSYFTYLAKAGYGDGAAAADFDDRTWRTLDLPHDWLLKWSFPVTPVIVMGTKKLVPDFRIPAWGGIVKHFLFRNRIKGNVFFWSLTAYFVTRKYGSMVFIVATSLVGIPVFLMMFPNT